MAPWEEYQAAAVAEPTATTALKPWEEYAAADTELPEVVATKEGGNGLVAKINAALGGKPGVSERPSQLATDVREAAPEGAPFVRGFGETASHVVPQSWGELVGLAESFVPPIEAYRQVRQGFDIASGKPAPEVIPGITELKDLEDIKAEHGGDSPEYQSAAGKAAGNVLSQMIMAGLVGKSLQVPTPNHYVGPRPPPDLPPSPSLGPGTIAGDVSKALERRFTLQEPPPEPPPDIAPSVPIEQTLPQIGEPPVFNPELGPQPQVDFQMPLRTETANMRTERILNKRQELLARKAATQDPVERAAIDAELMGPGNPVVHPPPAVEQRVQPGQFQKPGYTAVDTPPEAPVNAQEAPPIASDVPGSVPVAGQGTVRLYHGSSAEAPQAGRDFTTDRQYATDYAAKAQGSGEGKVWYVDVPEGVVKTHDEHGQPMTRVVVPDEIANQARPLTEEPYTPEASAQRAAQGPQKPSKIGQSIEAKAVEAKLTKGFPETAGYDPITIKDQAARASNLVENNPAHARSIIRGEAPLPPEIKGTSLITAMEEHLVRNPDPHVAYELANSRLVSLTSEAAQEMRLMAERVPDGITAKFAEIKAAREAGAKLRNETPAKVKAEINGEVVKAASKRPTWEQFVNEIVC